MEKMVVPPLPKRKLGPPNAGGPQEVQTMVRFNFQEISGVHAEPYDPSSLFVFLKTFTADELVENIVNFTNIYVDINMKNPAIQAPVAGKHCSVFHLNVVVSWSFPNYGCCTTARIPCVLDKATYFCYANLKLIDEKGPI